MITEMAGILTVDTVKGTATFRAYNRAPDQHSDVLCVRGLNVPTNFDQIDVVADYLGDYIPEGGREDAP